MIKKIKTPIVLVITVLTLVSCNKIGKTSEGPDTSQSIPLPPAQSQVDDIVITGTLECDGVGTLKPFSKAYSVVLTTTGSLKMEKFNSESLIVESWTGTVHDKSATIEGSYKNGSKIGNIALSGKYDESLLNIRGKRGARECIYIGSSL